MGVVFITADISGKKIKSHQLVIQPMFDILKAQGYDCRWAEWNPWGERSGFEDGEISCFVTGDVGVPAEYRGRAFFHPHGLHPGEQAYVSDLWYGYLSPGDWWVTVPDGAPMFSEEKTPVTGWAKLDVLFKQDAEEGVISQHGLGNLPYDKTVLYAPTGNWDWATSFDASVEHILDLFTRLPYNLLVKNGVYSESLEKWDYFCERIKNGPNNMRRIPIDSDISPLYLVSDLMITDGSSVAWEFIGVDKPVIQLNNMKDPRSAICPGLRDCQFCKTVSGYGGGDNRYKEHEECRTCGGTIKSGLNELESLLIENMEKPDTHAEERRTWAERVNKYVDGKCGDRCVEAIKRIAGI